MERRTIARGCAWAGAAAVLWFVLGIAVYAVLAGMSEPTESGAAPDVSPLANAIGRSLAALWLLAPAILIVVLGARAWRRRRDLRSD
jgi:heme/copper-type cytochrome/quinol oxidase subunit 2